MGMGMDGHATSNGHNNKNDTPVTSNGEGQHLNLNGHTNGHTNGHNGNTTTTTITTTTADPAPTLDPIEAGVRSGQTPTLGYQLQFRDPATLKRLQASPDDGIRQLLYGFWGSLTSTGERCFTPSSGLIWSQLPDMQPPPDHIISAADAAVYLDAYASSGGGILRGPLNWYKNMPLNVADETALARAHGGAMPGFAMPALFVQALGDDILVPELWGAMEGGEEEGKKGGFKRLDWVKVDWGHFCLWEGREEINGILERWLEGLEEVRGRSGEGEIR
ncbi:hypothetical protein F4778DRAFT_765143 [Xylariomycetidae sp. FL2044]|nr:hypothetical protein F4778DRAFT_765143 [Xylariomycetidae sp. FL2044]